MGTFGENFGIGFDVPGLSRGKFGANFGINFDVEQAQVTTGGGVVLKHIPRLYQFRTELRSKVAWNERTLLISKIKRHDTDFLKIPISKAFLSESVASIQANIETQFLSKIEENKLTPFMARVEKAYSDIMNSKIEIKELSESVSAVEYRKPRLKKLMRLYLIEELDNLYTEND